MFDRRLAAIARHDIDAIMADCAEDSVFVTPQGVFEGNVAIRSLLDGLLAEFSAPETTLGPQQRQVVGPLVHVTWSAKTPPHSYPFATDPLLVADGRIRWQTFAAVITPKCGPMPCTPLPAPMRPRSTTDSSCLRSSRHGGNASPRPLGSRRASMCSTSLVAPAYWRWPRLNMLGDEDRLRALFVDAGIADLVITTRHGSVRFASIDALISAEQACVWTLGGLLDADQFALLRRPALHALAAFAARDGGIEFDMPMHLVTADKHSGRSSRGACPLVDLASMGRRAVGWSGRRQIRGGQGALIPALGLGACRQPGAAS